MTDCIDFADMNARHAAAMAEVAASAGINIHGRRYTPVATRVEIFRKHFGCYGRLAIPEFEELPDGRLQMRAIVELLGSGGWVAFAEGRAEEVRGSSPITKTSALEVCETSAIGRALANFGLHGGEYASANEVEVAIAQQGNSKPDTKAVNRQARRITDLLDASRDDAALEVWNEVATDHDFASAVWATFSKPIQDRIREAKQAGRVQS